MKTKEEQFMLRALKLAQKGGRAVAPNPMVGAVIVKKGKVIGEGYHKEFGGPHAERNAIKSVKNPDDLRDATLYVTLEPCRHQGKTPPCLELIEEVGITQVVCGSSDPFQKRTKDYGLRTKLLNGPVAKQCKELNKFYFTWIEKKRPFVSVKVAVSADGFVAGANGEQVWLTTKAQDKEVHQARADHQAIMVGINTILNDDPELNVRHVKGADPLRVILDSKLRIPKSSKVLKNQNYLIATTSVSEQALDHLRIRVWVSPTKTHICLQRLLKYLAKEGISSVLVEPGPTLYKSLKKQNLIDELMVYQSNKKLTKGLSIDL